MRSYTTIIFDLGNVLIFHENARIDGALAELAGCTPDEVRRQFRRDGLWRAFDEGALDPAAFHREVCRRLGIGCDFGAFTRIWNGIFSLNRPVLPLLERLRDRYRLLILSNTNPIHLAHLRATYPIFDPFDHVIASCEVGCSKPDPAVFRLALERAGAEPRETVFTDDLERYTLAAEGVGITGIPFVSAEQLERDLAALGVLAP